MQNKRNSSIELLRILSMLMIVASHYFNIRKSLGYEITGTIETLFSTFLGEWAFVSVNIFVIISAYFLIDLKFSFKRILKIILQVVFYTVALYLGINILYKKNPINLKIFFNNVFPINTNMYWFVTAYILMAIVSPFLNISIKKMGQKMHFTCMLLLIIIGSVLHTITLDRFINPLSKFGWFLCVYFVGAYLKLYPIKMLETKSKTFALTIGLFLLIVIYNISWILLAKKVSLFKKGMDYCSYPTRLTNVVCLMFSVLVFNSFKLINIKHSKVINTLASGCFGVYILHWNHYVVTYLWPYLFTKINLSLIPHSILIIVVVLFVCIGIDLLRKFLLEKVFFKLFDKQITKTENFVKKIFNTCYEKFFKN